MKNETFYRQGRGGRFEKAFVIRPKRSPWLTFSQTVIAAFTAIIIAAIIWPTMPLPPAVTVNTPRDAIGRQLMHQSDFPCAEDEVLGFAAVEAFEGSSISALTASRDYVICLPVDLLRQNAIQEAFP